MNDNSSLLGQLKIDRGPSSNAPGNRRIVWLLPGVAVLALAGWWLLRGPEAVPVKVVTARVVSESGGSAASVLDASGYVIARRQATVSSKVTGKVIEVNVEEGMEVREGQILARLRLQRP